MTIPTPYRTYIYSDIYEIPHAYIQQNNLIELIQKYFTRCIRIKEPSKFEKIQIKKCEEETKHFMIRQNPIVISIFNRYIEFLQNQKKTF